MLSRLMKCLLFACSVLTILTVTSLVSAHADALQDAVAQLTPQEQATFKAYENALQNYAKAVDGYWHEVELKRAHRKKKAARGLKITLDDYVRKGVPVYAGPKRPDEIMAKLPKPPKPPVEEHEPVAVIPDFLQAADSVYNFKPDRVTEEEFMIFYAIEAMKLGLTKEQVVRVYALETGGMGTSDLQSGYNARTGHATSTALGYAQLLAANSIEQVRENGNAFAQRLEQLAAEKGLLDFKAGSLKEKASIVRKMHLDAKKMPNSWNSDVAFAKTPQGLAMHALNLDGDVGPWMQVLKLKSILEFAARKGMTQLTGAQLELMNLAGPGRGYEMMQPISRDVPTTNFFDRGGYARNPVVHDKTGAELLAKFDEIMDRNSQKERAVKFAEIFDTLARNQGKYPSQGFGGSSILNLFNK